MNEPLFLKPKFQERIWGGEKLNTEFGYEIPSTKTGECWAVSAHPNGTCQVANGQLKGWKLDEVWENHRELFGQEEGKQFPLLVKILDAADDLSVQVHPNDWYADAYENGQLGKTECWYIIDCEEDAQIIYGHHAKSKEEFVEMINSGQWDSLLRKVKVKQGDFFFVPSGTIHAIGAGIMILETQQSSDLTYRVYDYNRTDDKGQTRELHIDQSVAVTTIPHVDVKSEQQTKIKQGLTEKCLEKSHYFTVYHWDLAGEYHGEIEGKYLLCSVIQGEAHLTVNGEGYSLEKGTHFILPTTIKNYQLKGKAAFIVSHT